MSSKRWIALLVAVGAAGAIAFYAWPASAKQLKPRGLDGSPPMGLPVVRTLGGDGDPHDFNLSQLIPHGSQASGVWYAGQQILVKWVNRHKHFRHGLAKLSPPPYQWGLVMWSEKSATRWQAVNIPVIRRNGMNGDMRISFADVTGDGRADLLLEQHPGTNHGCGPHEAFATSRKTGVTTRVYSDYLCEAGLYGDHGLLALGMEYYIRNDSMCCASYHESLRLRWDGHRYVQSSVQIVKNDLRF
jgi:hypothetical protein